MFTFNSEILRGGEDFQNIVPLQKAVTFDLWTDHPIVDERERSRGHVALINTSEFKLYHKYIWKDIDYTLSRIYNENNFKRLLINKY